MVGLQLQTLQTQTHEHQLGDSWDVSGTNENKMLLNIFTLFIHGTETNGVSNTAGEPVEETAAVKQEDINCLTNV